MKPAEYKCLVQNARQEGRPCVSLISRQFSSGRPVVTDPQSKVAFVMYCFLCWPRSALAFHFLVNVRCRLKHGAFTVYQFRIQRIRCLSNSDAKIVHKWFTIEEGRIPYNARNEETFAHLYMWTKALTVYHMLWYGVVVHAHLSREKSIRRNQRLNEECLSSIFPTVKNMTYVHMTYMYDDGEEWNVYSLLFSLKWCSICRKKWAIFCCHCGWTQDSQRIQLKFYGGE